MLNGTEITSGSIARLGVGTETGIDSELAEVGGFRKEVLGCWIQGEDVETFPEDPFEMVKARIVSDDERQLVEVSGRAGGE